MLLKKQIANFAVFLEFPGEGAINPDDAIQALEQLAATLQMASEEVRSSLCSSFRDISGEYKGERAEFVESFGEGLGLMNRRHMPPETGCADVE